MSSSESSDEIGRQISESIFGKNAIYSEWKPGQKITYVVAGTKIVREGYILFVIEPHDVDDPELGIVHQVPLTYVVSPGGDTFPDIVRQTSIIL